VCRSGKPRFFKTKNRFLGFFTFLVFNVTNLYKERTMKYFLNKLTVAAALHVKASLNKAA